MSAAKIPETRDLMTLAEATTPQQLAQLRLFETWRVKKLKGKWVVMGQRNASQSAIAWLHFKMLIRADYKPQVPEMHLTGLGQQLLALKAKTAKPAAPSHQEKAA